MRLSADAQLVRGLWDVEVTAVGRFESALGEALNFRRVARAHIQLSRPTAALRSTVLRTVADGPRQVFTLEVEAATPGRYELRSVLYATSPSGDLLPVAVAHSAAWLEAGRSSVELSFEGWSPDWTGPYELRDLRLMDQGRLALLETRARGQRWEQ